MAEEGRNEVEMRAVEKAAREALDDIARTQLEGGVTPRTKALENAIKVLLENQIRIAEAVKRGPDIFEADGTLTS